MNCPKCGSENVSTERRIDGMKTCLDCGYKWRNVAQAGHVVTSCHEDRTYKRCLCCVCGEIHKCTPSFDFYTTDDHGEALVCERCFHEYLGHRLNAEKWVADLNARNNQSHYRSNRRTDQRADRFKVIIGKSNKDQCTRLQEKEVGR